MPPSLNTPSNLPSMEPNKLASLAAALVASIEAGDVCTEGGSSALASAIAASKFGVAAAGTKFARHTVDPLPAMSDAFLGSSSAESSAASPSPAVLQRRREDLELDDKWVANLDETRQGQYIVEHLTHMQGLLNTPDVPMESSIDQCCTFRRVFSRAVADSAVAFGLPKKMPRYIAIVNFTGRRMILYSDRPVLFQLLAHAQDNGNKTAVAHMEAGVRQMLGFLQQNPHHSCLLCYSMPFSSGLSELHWEMRAVRRHGKGDLRDGAMCFRLGDDNGAYTVQSTQSCESASSAPMLLEVVKEMSANLAAVDLDVGDDCIDSTMSGVVDKRVEVLEQLCTRLQHERKTMQEAHKTEMKQVREQYESRLEAAEASHGETYAQTNAAEQILRTQLEKATREGLANLDVADAANMEINRLRSDLTSKNVELEEEIVEMKRVVARLEKQLANAQRKIGDANDLRARELKKRDELHLQTAERLEKRLATAQLDVQKAEASAENYLKRLNTLSYTMNSADAVKEAMGSDIVRHQRRVVAYKCVVAVAALKYEARTTDLKKARMAHVEADAALKDVKKEAKAQKRVAEQASQRADRFGNERDDFERQVAALQQQLDESRVPTPTPTVETVERETMTVRVTSQAELELGELQTKHAKLIDESDEKTKELVLIKSELERCKLRAARRPPPPSFMPTADVAVTAATTTAPLTTTTTAAATGDTVANAPHAARTTPTEHSDATDSSVEALINQTALGLRSIFHLARENGKQQRNVLELSAQLRALQSYAQPQPYILPHFAPGYNGYNNTNGY